MTRQGSFIYIAHFIHKATFFFLYNFIVDSTGRRRQQLVRHENPEPWWTRTKSLFDRQHRLLGHISFEVFCSMIGVQVRRTISGFTSSKRAAEKVDGFVASLNKKSLEGAEYWLKLGRLNENNTRCFAAKTEKGPCPSTCVHACVPLPTPRSWEAAGSAAGCRRQSPPWTTWSSCSDDPPWQWELSVNTTQHSLP